MRLTMMQQLIQEGVKLGIKQPQIQVPRMTIIDILKHRLGNVPNKLKKQIESIDDEEVLQSLIIDALTCSNIKDFQEKL
ncbi:MAG: hypothetical protein IJG38_08435 [Thermoguttaceae bacterium]|nr:hypothetical protein [Thermoguttaceae bacterium]